jgi:hypothetical protein
MPNGAKTMSKPAKQFNLNVAELLLARAATAQKAYWDALAALEREMGFEINTDDLGELDAYTVRDLYKKFA